MAKTSKPPISSTNARGKRPRLDTVSEDDDSGVELEICQPATSTTPTTTTSAKQKTQTKSTRHLRDALETHMIYLDERTARERNSDFLARVQAILKGDRSSEKSERSVNAIKESQHTNRVAMENTYLTAVLPQMIGPSRTVKIPPERSTHDLSSSSLRMDEFLSDSSNPEVLPRMMTVVRSFAEDRLHWEGPCYFVKELITGPRTVKIFGITDPQPDMGFGIRKRGLVFNPPILSDDTKNLGKRFCRKDVKEFCRDLHNILDWGIDPKRIVKLEQMVSDIEKKEAAGMF
ncbi:MAG: hypothetical protein Q9193_006782 [Seirophora villosa]